MYALLRQALFALDGERAHRLTLAALARNASAAAHIYGRRVPAVPVELMGLRLPNPVGLAAGLDKDGRCIDGLAGLGFGFLEIGTVTPRPQPGNPKPRLLRLIQERALINRMGFNNDGVDALVARLAAARYRGVLGINIGKNRDTPNADALKDYLRGLRAVHEYASYVTINVSSPNTRGLRELQGRESLDRLLDGLIVERDRLADRDGRRVPLAVKIGPDSDEAALEAISRCLQDHGIDAVIATNTTTARDGLAPRWQEETGGLSGAPLRAPSDAVIRTLHRHLGDEIPIIGVGGIATGADAAAKIAAGARAIQLYTGLIYKGPALVRDCARAIAEHS